MSNKLQTAVEIAEEIKLAIIPMMVEIENKGEDDTYITCRGIYRQMKELVEKLKEVAGGGNNDCKNKNHELEKTQKLSEKLHSLLQLWMEGNLTEDDAYILSIATDINHNVLQEIARVKGVECS
ncbi:hypothetical protein [Xenorhabdus bovienii]|uniref:hypothetical protein n=1 Tax=Xenorhabdus bovienii TaxID=40576 RepID=UPI0023B294CE|nr:hypothetical protein [Xenorhabdus bovienii]MDE9471014.1 hypothetical protein [Xenorhabdus bovienii]